MGTSGAMTVEGVTPSLERAEDERHVGWERRFRYAPCGMEISRMGCDRMGQELFSLPMRRKITSTKQGFNVLLTITSPQPAGL